MTRHYETSPTTTSQTTSSLLAPAQMMTVLSRLVGVGVDIRKGQGEILL